MGIYRLSGHLWEFGGVQIFEYIGFVGHGGEFPDVFEGYWGYSRGN